MVNWISILKADPRPTLLKTNNAALQFFIRRDLCDESLDSITHIWELPEVQKLLKKQQNDGSWPDPHQKKHVNSGTNYKMVETYRTMGILVQLYGMTKEHPAIQKAAEFFFTTQTEEGDFRGIYGHQYSPNYSAGILELLIEARYEREEPIHRSFKWLLSIQQDKGGWTLPLQTHRIKMQDTEQYINQGPLLPFQKEKIFSHFVTGIVLRPFGAHPEYCKHPDAIRAGNLITQRFFKDDIYTSYKAAENWEHYSIPFWWNDYIATLDALSKMGYTPENSGIQAVLNHFKKTQNDSGIWELHLLKGKSIPDLNLWGNLILCRIFRRLYSQF